MALDVLAREHRIGKGVFNRAAQYALDLLANVCRSIAADDNTSQWQRQTGASLPLEAQIGNELEVAALIDKAPLVNQHTRIEVATLNGSSNLGEEHRRAALNLGEEALHQCVSRSVQARDNDLADGAILALASDEQRAIAATECRAAIKERIPLGDGGQQGATDLADVGRAALCGGVKLLDIVVLDLEAQPLAIDAAVDHCIEHKGVVGTGRYV